MVAVVVSGRERGPVMAFIRCDRGSVPADHQTLAMLLQPRTEYVHSAYQLTDPDEVAASGEYRPERGYRHAWRIGRHIEGSQIFDYWRDRDRFMVEHHADGGMFDSSIAPGWAPLSVSGLAQWGRKPPRNSPAPPAGALLMHRRAGDAAKEVVPALLVLAITIAYLAVAVTG